MASFCAFQGRRAFGLSLESQLQGCTGLAGKRGAMQHPCGSNSRGQTVGIVTCDRGNLSVQGLQDVICDFERGDDPLCMNKQ